MSAARKLRPDTIGNYVATLADQMVTSGGHAAEVALKAGLVTDIKSRLEVEDLVKKIVGEDEQDGGFKAVSVHDYVRVVRAEQRLTPDGTGEDRRRRGIR